jgi:hypothetical protein
VKLVVIIYLFLVISGCTSQNRNSDKSNAVDQYQGEKILVGKFTPNELWTEIPTWKADYDLYQPDQAIVDELSVFRDNYRIVCVLGVWCSDSRDGVPTFLKALDVANLTRVKIELFGVDRKKEDPLASARKYGVERVPTFIIYREDKEIGRMIEFPEISFELDFLKIIRSTN